MSFNLPMYEHDWDFLWRHCRKQALDIHRERFRPREGISLREEDGLKFCGVCTDCHRQSKQQN